MAGERHGEIGRGRAVPFVRLPRPEPSWRWFAGGWPGATRAAGGRGRPGARGGRRVCGRLCCRTTHVAECRRERRDSTVVDWWSAAEERGGEAATAESATRDPDPASDVFFCCGFYSLWADFLRPRAHGPLVRALFLFFPNFSFSPRNETKLEE